MCHAPRVSILECVNANQSNHVLRRDTRAFDDYGATHRVPDKNNTFQLEKVHDCHDIVAKSRNCPVITIEARFSMSCKIQSHNSVVLGGVFELPSPVAAVACPAVHENRRTAYR